jgi:hypothetical protein
VDASPTIRSCGLQPRIIAGAADAGLFRALITCASNYLEDFVGPINTAKYVQNGPITGEESRVEDCEGQYGFISSRPGEGDQLSPTAAGRTFRETDEPIRPSGPEPDFAAC